MRAWIAILFLLVAGGGVVAAQSKPASTPAVVVELFTSEGCSSCPPADALLVELSRQPLTGVEVIPLGFHVDYWNELGWKDRFSSRQFTVRQDGYARQFTLDSVYTPQMVVAGRYELVGSAKDEVRAEILKASRLASPASVRLSLRGDRDLDVDVAGAGDDAAQVWLAVTEDGLATSASGGENSGTQLHHAAVVRDLRLLGNTTRGSFHGQARLSWLPEWKPGNVHVVVFAQRAGSGILGATTLQPSLAGARR